MTTLSGTVPGCVIDGRRRKEEEGGGRPDSLLKRILPAADIALTLTVSPHLHSAIHNKLISTLKVEHLDDLGEPFHSPTAITTLHVK